MIEIILRSIDFHVSYAKALTEGLKAEDCFEGAGPGLENHPAFTLGHLSTAANLMTKYLGGEYALSTEWDELFRRKGPGDPKLPLNGMQHYPSMKEILETFIHSHNTLKEQIASLTADQLCEAIKWRFNSWFPDVGGLLSFMCWGHMSMHLGQLSAWRRAKGYPSALAQM